MKDELNKNQLGLTLGVFSALLHAIWVAAIGVGVGKTFIDWVMPLHFLNVVYSLYSFTFSNAIILVVLALIGGYICGWLFALLWNWIGEQVK